MILDNERNKLQLDIKSDFNTLHAKMLLKYQTYLLYDLRIKLESADAYAAINYFLERVTGKISNNSIVAQFVGQMEGMPRTCYLAPSS